MALLGKRTKMRLLANCKPISATCIAAEPQGDRPDAPTPPAHGLVPCARDVIVELRTRAALLFKRRRFAEARRLLLQAFALAPHDVLLHNELGAVELLLGDFRPALAHYRHVLAERPDDARAYYNCGSALYGQGLLDEALHAYNTAAKLDPQLALADIGAASVHLLREAYDAGWPLYERRLELASFGQSPRPAPRWSGQKLCGKRILLWAEQGLGDTIQFLRFVRVVAELGARVVLCLPPTLHGLIPQAMAVETVLAPGDRHPEVDYECPLMSLAMICGFARQGQRGPYLQPRPEDARKWTEHLSAYDGLRVGIAWSGSPHNLNNLHRSLPLRLLEPLANVNGVHLFSLQRGSGSEELRNCRMRIDGCETLCRDLAETAAFIASLDLVISVDTSIAHLAGALGKPTWVLLAYMPHWAWLIGREDSPWYSTAQLFRQNTPGDWGSIVEKVRIHLQNFAHPGQVATERSQ